MIDMKPHVTGAIATWKVLPTGKAPPSLSSRIRLRRPQAALDPDG